MPENDPYLEWLANAPKGFKLHQAQEAWNVYQERQKRQTEEVAWRLMGKRKKDCPQCLGGDWDEWHYCTLCNGTGEINA